MKYLSGIFRLVNANWSSRVFTLVLIGLLTYSAVHIFTAKGKAKCEDCTPFKEQNRELISALIDIKKDLQASTTSYNGLQKELIMFASFDTIPRQYQQKQQIQKVVSRIDSILLKYKQDSIKQKLKT